MSIITVKDLKDALDKISKERDDDFIRFSCMNPNMYKKQDWEKFSENY